MYNFIIENIRNKLIDLFYEYENYFEEIKPKDIDIDNCKEIILKEDENLDELFKSILKILRYLYKKKRINLLLEQEIDFLVKNLEKLSQKQLDSLSEDTIIFGVR